MSMDVNTPRSGIGPISNVSSAPRSKLFELFSSGIFSTDVVFLPSFSPYIVMLTFASVPANMMSEVCTVIW